MTQRMTDLIRSVRACKTAAEERAVIAKESALIRTAFKDGDKQHRCRNIAKLLFIHMLGYPSHFGQMECVRLIASPSFAEKRMGYLGLILLLTDQEEVLTLVTNSVKIDMNNANPYVAALALTAAGNVANADMARDLVMDIDKLLRGDNDNLRKKAALAAVRVFQQVPDLVEDFAESIQSLLRTKNHGVLICGIHLIREVLALDRANVRLFEDLVKTLVRDLRNLLSMGFSSDYDVSGIIDPFLQVAILKLLRYLGRGNAEASEAMNDVLAQVATNTESAKNAGNAILYECVQTIMAIESDNGLKVLAINILGRFLLNRDNNIRYVALNTLSKVIVEDAAAVQRHTNTIVDCLKDPDTSIRQRALELIYALVNSSNIQTLAREMLNYLVIAPSEQKPALCSKIADAVDRYALSNRWHIDTLITMLSIAGSALPDDRITSSLIALIQRSPELHAYVVYKLYTALNDDTSQLALVHVGVWCVGEYGNLLLLDPPADEETLANKTKITEASILELLQRCLRHHAAADATKAYVLTAMAKLTTRFSSAAEIQQLRQIIATFNTSVVLDLQQRACEYTILEESRWDALRPGIMEPMPSIDLSKVTSRNTSAMVEDMPRTESNVDAVQVPTTAADPVILDLDNIFGTGAPSVPDTAPTLPVESASATTASANLLDDLFSLNPTPVVSAPVAASTAPVNDLVGLLDFGAPAPVAAAPPPTPTVRAYEKNGLTVDLTLSKPKADDPSMTQMEATIRNNSPVDLTNVVFLAAFPKFIKLKMEPASSDQLPTNGGAITQTIKIQNTMHGEKPVAMRIRLEFLVDGNKVEDMVTVSSYPPNY